jgi:hypothetical protein
MAKQARRPKHTALRATFWFVVVMLPSWGVLLFGCEFEPSSIGHHPHVADSVFDDNDGGE